jgi:hypothetical protein
VTAASYKTHDPRGYGGDPKRGAALGRPDRIGDPAYAGVLTLRRVRIDRDGYDGLGTYWGSGGAPLYWFASRDHYIDRSVRAAGREAARAFVLREYPNATVKP